MARKKKRKRKRGKNISLPNNAAPITIVPHENIIVEDKTNTAKNQSNEYKPNEIFKFSDALVDSLTSMIDREYKKKLN